MCSITCGQEVHRQVSGKKNKEGTQLLSGVGAEAEEAEVIIGRVQPEAETSRRGQSGHDPERKGGRGAAS